MADVTKISDEASSVGQQEQGEDLAGRAFGKNYYLSPKSLPAITIPSQGFLIKYDLLTS